ncbi:N-acetyltransferase [Enterobacteriaceae bacterium ESL0689]|nr:N-acetyltransferase [Enterobacteriaceae bacterium ESL0689]
MLIRVEIGIDAPGIDALLRRTFSDDSQAKRVHHLRQDSLITLGLVATDDEGQIIGYVAFTPVSVAGEERQWVALAPLAVDKPYRQQGIASQLVYEGLDALNEFGYAAVVTQGDPALFQHLGFVLATDFDLHYREPKREAPLQIYPLAGDALNGVQGLVEYSAPFNYR